MGGFFRGVIIQGLICIYSMQSFFAAIVIVAGFVAIFAAQVYAIVLLVRWLFPQTKRPALFAGNHKSLLK